MVLGSFTFEEMERSIEAISSETGRLNFKELLIFEMQSS